MQGNGNPDNSTGGTGNDNLISSNSLRYCGNRGINADTTFRTKIQYNTVRQSWAAGIQTDVSTSAGVIGSANGEISGNVVQDTELQYNSLSLHPNGNGDINILSSGHAGGSPGSLQGWLIHDNYVINTNTPTDPICTARVTPKTGHSGLSPAPPDPSDSGCSEGIQVTENPWNVSVYNNYIYNTGSEGITLCEYNCSATGNYVGDSGQGCSGCGGIIQAVQYTAGVVTLIGNSVIEGNTIWNDSTAGNPVFNSGGVMNYCMWQNVNVMVL